MLLRTLPTAYTVTTIGHHELLYTGIFLERE